jgi:hypothetical protein
MRRTGKKTAELRAECEKLTGNFRLGCFHGLGNAHMPAIVRGKTSMKDVCLTGTESDDEQFVCIEGAIERMAKYREESARKSCEGLEGKHEEACLNAVKQKMYNMEKDLTLYLTD